MDGRNSVWKRGLTAAMLLAAVSFAGCNKPAANTAANTAAATAAPAAAAGAPSAADDSFNASFDKATHDSCVPSAEAHGATSDHAEKYCTCVVQQLDKLTAQQKMALNGDSPELGQAAATCNAQVTG